MRKLIILAMTLFLIMSAQLNANAPAGAQTLEQEVEAAIAALIQEKPNHRLLKSPKKMREMSSAAIRASEITGTDWKVSIVIARYETSFHKELVGTIGERGVMQVSPYSKRRCAEYLGRKVDLSNLDDQFICGNLTFENALDFCKTDDLKEGLSYYATGKTCKPKTRTLKWIVRRRYDKIQELKNL